LRALDLAPSAGSFRRSGLGLRNHWPSAYPPALPLYRSCASWISPRRSEDAKRNFQTPSDSPPCPLAGGSTIPFRRRIEQLRAPGNAQANFQRSTGTHYTNVPGHLGTSNNLEPWSIPNQHVEWISLPSDLMTLASRDQAGPVAPEKQVPCFQREHGQEGTKGAACHRYHGTRVGLHNTESSFLVTKASISRENHATFSKLKPRSSRSMGTSISLEPSVSSDQVVKRPRSPIQLPSIGAKDSWKKRQLALLGDQET
jgi:hypothetical protein